MRCITAIGNKQPPRLKEAEEVFRVGSMHVHSPVSPAHGVTSVLNFESVPARMIIKALSDANQHIHSDPHSVGVSHAA